MKIRDKEAIFLFVIGMGLSIFILLSGYQLLNGWLNQTLKKQDEGSYRNQIMLKVPDPSQQYDVWYDEEMAAWEEEQLKQTKAILDVLVKQETVTYIDNLSVPVGNASNAARVMVILAGEEEWYRTLEEGVYPSHAVWQREGQQAVISRAEEKYVETIAGKRTIKIAGVNYDVRGVFYDYDITDSDEMICIYYKPESEDDYLTKRLAGRGFDICVGSNYQDVTEAAIELKEALEAITGTEIEMISYEDEGDDITQKLYVYIKSVLFGILFAVSLLNCWQITRFWIMRKKRDLAIMRTFGMGNWKILRVISGELLIGILAAAGIATALNSGYSLYSGRTVVELRVGIQNTGWLLLLFGIVILVTILPVIGRIWKQSPIEGIKGD